MDWRWPPGPRPLLGGCSLLLLAAAALLAHVLLHDFSENPRERRSLPRAPRVEAGTWQPEPSSPRDPPPPHLCELAPSSRFDCAPGGSITEQQCKDRGCCYQPVEPPGDARMGQPWCFFPACYQGYALENLTATATGYTATLTRDSASFFPNDIMTLQLTVLIETKSRLRLTVGRGGKGAAQREEWEWAPWPGERSQKCFSRERRPRSGESGPRRGG